MDVTRLINLLNTMKTDESYHIPVTSAINEHEAYGRYTLCTE